LHTLCAPETRVYRVNQVHFGTDRTPSTRSVWQESAECMKIKRETLKRLVTITLEHEPEDSSYQVEFEESDAARNWIREQLDKCNTWAWCQVTVTARLGGFETKDYLGACSYENENDFKNGGYYESMIDSCVAEMADEIERIVNSHDLWDHEAASCLWCAVA
jgi:hypothetical protein